jgi:pyrroline-5-carboxylate reductase
MGTCALVPGVPGDRVAGRLWHSAVMTTIAVLGAGKIGEALLAGLLKAGRSPDDLMFTERYPDRAAQLEQTYRVRAVDTVTAAGKADVLVVAVKPQDIDPLLAELAGLIGVRTLVVSLCAGLPTTLYERRLPDGVPVVRVMSNTPMLVGEAMSALSAGRFATDAHLKLTEELLGSVGKVVRVPETQQDAVTALSGSGPAYFFYLVEAMIDAGILLGLPRPVVTELITQSAVGAARMLRETGDHPVLLREAVTSPGGTTIMAIRELERHGVRAALLAAIEAAQARSAELGAAHHDSGPPTADVNRSVNSH